MYNISFAKTYTYNYDANGNVDGYGSLRIVITGEGNEFGYYKGYIDNYNYTDTKCKVNIYIGKPMSASDALFESREWITNFSESGFLSALSESAENLSVSNILDIADAMVTVADKINKSINPLYGKVSEGDIVATVKRIPTFGLRKEYKFYFHGNDKSRCYYVKE